MDTKQRPRMPSQEEIAIVNDLAKKATMDALNATHTSAQLLVETIGPIAAAILALRVVYGFLLGAGLVLVSDRTGKIPDSETQISQDDLLFLAMLAVAMGSEGMNATDVARQWFLGATRRDIDLPEWWRRPSGVQS